MSLLFFLSCSILLVHIWTLADIGQGLFRMKSLKNEAVNLPPRPPRVSVIVPACNEADTIEPALLSLLEQDYPNLEVIVVNDRSTDETGAVLAKLQDANAKPFQIITVTELPEGWLGKSNGLQKGADYATGEILLFTDADVEMETTVISRAVTVFEASGLDHLSLIFQAVGGGWLLNGMILDAGSGLLAMFKPWKVSDAGSNRFMGVGAFNMVRAEVYRKIGGHSTFCMHPIDDIMLGKTIKENNYKQACLLGLPLVRVPWYATPSQMVEGLMKNVFSVLHYRVWLALIAIMMIFILTILPVLGLLLTSGNVQLLFGTSVVIRLGGLAIGARLCAMQPATILGGLIAPLMSIYIIARAVYFTLRNRGLYWRGTFYHLKELRKSKRLLL